jgi:hypothetical protein
MNELPDEIAELFTKPMGFPNSATEQELFVYRGEDLSDRLGSSGTIVYMPECDRLTHANTRRIRDQVVWFRTFPGPSKAESPERLRGVRGKRPGC